MSNSSAYRKKALDFLSSTAKPKEDRFDPMELRLAMNDILAEMSESLVGMVEGKRPERHDISQRYNAITSAIQHIKTQQSCRRTVDLGLQVEQLIILEVIGSRLDQLHRRQHERLWSSRWRRVRKWFIDQLAS